MIHTKDSSSNNLFTRVISKSCLEKGLWEKIWSEKATTRQQMIEIWLIVGTRTNAAKWYYLCRFGFSHRVVRALVFQSEFTG